MTKQNNCEQTHTPKKGETKKKEEEEKVTRLDATQHNTRQQNFVLYVLFIHISRICFSTMRAPAVAADQAEHEVWAPAVGSLKEGGGMQGSNWGSKQWASEECGGWWYPQSSGLPWGPPRFSVPSSARFSTSSCSPSSPASGSKSPCSPPLCANNAWSCAYNAPSLAPSLALTLRCWLDACGCGCGGVRMMLHCWMHVGVAAVVCK